MKFTSEDLLKVMGLKIGDVIKTSVGIIYEIVKDNNIIYLYPKNNDIRVIETAKCLINLEFEILPPVKKVGDMKCKDFKTCKECPLRFIHYCYSENHRLFDTFKNLKKYDDKEIEAIIERRLNEEVK